MAITIGTYEFHYINSGVVQQKVLIKDLWYRYSKLLPEKGRKRAMKCIVGSNEWFTDKSPLYEAINSGKLQIYNGTYVPCIVTKLKPHTQLVYTE